MACTQCARENVEGLCYNCRKIDESGGVIWSLADKAELDRIMDQMRAARALITNPQIRAETLAMLSKNALEIVQRQIPNTPENRARIGEERIGRLRG